MPGRKANLPWARMAEKKGGGEGRKMEKKKNHLANHKFQRPSHICVLSAFSG